MDHHVLVLALLRLSGRRTQERQFVGETMSNNPIDLRQDRREWLKTSAAALGASLLRLPPAPAETPQAEPAPAAPPEQAASESKSAGRFFAPAQHALVDELSETIIPADGHSGGAKAAKGADYIDKC